MKLLLVGILCFTAVAAVSDQELRKLFKEWKVKFNRNYGVGLKNELARFGQFKKSAKTIDYINSIQDDWVAGFTLFSDMTDEEKAAYTGINLNHTLEGRVRGADPAPFDPTDPKKQYWDMGPVKNQWSCGSCWAFAAVGVLEGRHLKEHGEFRDFSEQTILDCTFEEHNRDGCNGGFSDMAVNWVGNGNNIPGSVDHGYLPLRRDNPYVGEDRKCTELKSPLWNGLRRSKPRSYSARWREQNDAGLQHALATEGPVVVYIYSSWALPFYTTGTYRGTGCGENPTINHAVVAAGYEKDYWYVKNSWGTTWGYSGYVYFSRGWENLCSISSSRKVVEWRPNTKWDMCSDTHPTERTPCDSAELDEAACQAKGCCYDASYGPKSHNCFKKGKVTIFDKDGKKRVLYASATEFSQFEFSYYGASAQVEIGAWKLFESADYYGGSKVIRPEDGKVTFDFQSVQIL